MDIIRAVFCCFNGEDDAIYSKIDYSDESDPPLQPFLKKQPLNDCFTTSVYHTFNSKAHANESESTVDHVSHAPLPRYLNGNNNWSDNEKNTAKDIVSRLYAADTPESLSDEFRVEDWTETLARHILDSLIGAINSGRAMGGAVRETYEKVAPQVEDFVHEHPVLTAVVTTLIAICILEYLVPWAIAALGFAELGPVEGSFAAWWQSLYGDVPYGSLFSFLQKIGMRLGNTAFVDKAAVDETFGDYVWQKYVDGEHIYTIGWEFTRVDAEYSLVDRHILTELFCAKSRDALDKALNGIKWTDSLAQILLDTFDEDYYYNELERDGRMKEVHDKVSATAVAMGFFVVAPRPTSSTRRGEGSLDPFIIDLGMLSIMIPSLIEALGFTECPFEGTPAPLWPFSYTTAQHTPAGVSYGSLIAFFRASKKNEGV